MSLRSSISKRIKSFEKKFAVYNNIYISRSAILHNFDLLSKLSPGGLVIPVLKSNAYGHGLDQITEILKSRKIPYLAVDGYFEALQIHDISNQPVLVMGYIKDENYAKINPKRCAFVVHTIESLRAMGVTKKPFKIHIELETGMGRHGVKIDELTSFLKNIKKYKNIQLEGIMSHLADADNPVSTEHIDMQIKRFDMGVEKIKGLGFNPKYVHIAQSAGSTKVNSKYANTIRPGIALYGINPLEVLDKNMIKLQELQPALSLTSTITKILPIEINESVGYNCTFVANQKTLIGVIPLGYYEGLPRNLSNNGKVRWRHMYLSIVGRVCMNHTMVDLKHSNAKTGDEIIIISSNPTDKISIKNICKNNGLFVYDILVSLNQNIRRTIIR